MSGVISDSEQVQTTLDGDQKLELNLGKGVAGSPKAPIALTISSAKFYEVIPTRQVDPNVIKQFMSEAEARENSGKPMAPEEVEMQATAKTTAFSIK